MGVLRLEHFDSVPGGLPTWEYLRENALNKSKKDEGFEQVRAFKKLSSSWRLRAGRSLADHLVREPTLRHYHDASWDEIIDLMMAQLAENRWISQHKGHEAADLGTLPATLPYGPSAKEQFACTAWSVHRRVEIARAHVTTDEPILLIGDADFLSIGLARAKFKNIIVASQSMASLSAIARCARAEHHAITLKHCSLKHLSGWHERGRNYALVFADPAHDINALKNFLNIASKISAGNEERTRFFLSTNLMALLRRGLTAFDEHLKAQNFFVESFYPGFNAYPVPIKHRALLTLAKRALVFKSTSKPLDLEFSFFTSDGILMKKVQSEDPHKPSL